MLLSFLLLQHCCIVLSLSSYSSSHRGFHKTQNDCFFAVQSTNPFIQHAHLYLDSVHTNIGRNFITFPFLFLSIQFFKLQRACCITFLYFFSSTFHLDFQIFVSLGSLYLFAIRNDCAIICTINIRFGGSLGDVGRLISGGQNGMFIAELITT